MKKLMIGIMAVIMIGIGVIAGCKPTPEDINLIAKNAGLFSAVTWIAYDNPSTDVKSNVVDVLNVAEGAITNVQSGQTYAAVIYPIVEKAVVASTKIKPQDKPLVLAGSLAMLNGIDILFASHPEWKTNETIAQNAAIAFINGAEQGLALPSSNPMLLQASNGNQMRALIFKKK